MQRYLLNTISYGDLGSASYRCGMIFQRLHAQHPRPAKRKPGLFAAVSACAILAAGQAAASCAPGSAGPRDFVCTGALGSTSMPSARTVALTKATVSGYFAFNPTVGGNIGFFMDSSSSVTATGSMFTPTGVALTTFAGSIDTNTPSGAGINGAITASKGPALYATTSGAGSNINISTGASGVLTGVLGGLYASTDNDGAINLNLGGKVDSSSGVAVATRAENGATNIAANADISGHYAGIEAITSGNGAINITSTRNITAAGGVAAWGTAIYVDSWGSGNISINAKGDLTGQQGVAATGKGGDVTVNAAGAIDGGVFASTNGNGAVTVTTGAGVVKGSGDGLTAFSQDGWSVVNVGTGGVDVGNIGVLAEASVKGSVKVLVHGDVAGAALAGVFTSTDSGSIQIDLDKGTFVSSDALGVGLRSQSGTTTLNNAGTIDGGAKGTGVAVDVNAGTMTLNNSGTIASTGPAAIAVTSGAALIVNSGVVDGMITNKDLTTIQNDGVWKNAGGSSVSYLINNGTLSLGPSAGAAGVLTVTGDASFGPKSYYNARISPAGADLISVAGATTIDGGALDLVAAKGAYARGAKYLVLESAGGVTGRFGSVRSNGSAFTGALSYDAGSVYMTMLLRDFRPFALTRNQGAVANAVFAGSSVLDAGLGTQLLTALNQTPDAAVPAALTQLSGDGVVTGATNAALQAGHMFTSMLDDQSAVWREGVPRDVDLQPIRPFQYAPTRVDGQSWPVSRQTYSPAPREDPSTKRWRVWASGFGGQASLRGDQKAGSQNQKIGSYGGAIGVDYQVGRHFLIGVAGGGSTSNFATSNASGSTTGGHVGLYAGYRVGGFYGSASVAYSAYSNSAKRTVAPIGGVAGGQQTADFASEEVRTRLEVGKRFEMDALSITPFTAVEIAHIHTRPFVETSAGALGGPGLFGLSFAAQGTASTPSFIGVKAQARIDMAGVVFSPWVSVAWRHEWSASRTQTASLVALPTASFVAIGARPARDAAQVKAGAALEISRTALVFAAFEGEFGAGAPVYTGRGGVKVGW